MTCPDLTCPNLTCPDLTCLDSTFPNLTFPYLTFPDTIYLLSGTIFIPCIHSSDTYQTPFRYLPATFPIPSRNLSDTFQTPSRHPLDTLQTPYLSPQPIDSFCNIKLGVVLVLFVVTLENKVNSLPDKFKLVQVCSSMP